MEWSEGALLVLAGPGSGKTQVLTCRIATLLEASREQNFRILALTFTNKAADEMKGRVAALVPGLEERANIGTFHSFCAQILRQHGVHLGINPDFAIYSGDDDRRAVLEDALNRMRSEGRTESREDVKYLGLIDRMKSQLIEPASAEAALGHLKDARKAAAIYQLYDDELRRINALDFNSLIFEAYRFMKTFPAIAARYCTADHILTGSLMNFRIRTARNISLCALLLGTDFKKCSLSLMMIKSFMSGTERAISKYRPLLLISRRQ